MKSSLFNFFTRTRIQQIQLFSSNNPTLLDTMGSILSGRHGLRAARPTNEQIPSWRLTNKALYGVSDGRQAITARLESPDLVVLSAGRLVQPVGLVHQPRHFGGAMRWVLCPICDRRCGVIYLHHGRFGCRQCHGVVAATQRENRRTRLFRREADIRRRLGWPVGVFDMSLGKPRYMRWSTFAALTAELLEVSSLATGLIEEWTAKAEKVF
ncbi:hypothetical protein PSQ39_11820 [Curvibacter sp. HBC28]|uniref:Uncharacterized protein n=1 Tax=Curvibacter microcysteis TaxID=3026419 RepID=A0ABT5MG26_9BURK|nr:hypothetical protein [Curvibacter sp. HBC28]MDD0815320.1 hypothetical protein [Curvibacter sp. HBC28]